MNHVENKEKSPFSYAVMNNSATIERHERADREAKINEKVEKLILQEVTQKIKSIDDEIQEEVRKKEAAVRAAGGRHSNSSHFALLVKIEYNQRIDKEIRADQDHMAKIREEAIKQLEEEAKEAERMRLRRLKKEEIENSTDERKKFVQEKLVADAEKEVLASPEHMAKVDKLLAIEDEKFRKTHNRDMSKRDRQSRMREIVKVVAKDMVVDWHFDAETLDNKSKAYHEEYDKIEEAQKKVDEELKEQEQLLKKQQEEAAKNAAIKAAEEKQARKEAKIAQLKEALKAEVKTESEAERAKKDAEVAQLKAELEEARNAAKDKNSVQEKEIAQLKAELEEARNAAKEAEAKKDAHENEIAQLKAELNKTRNTAAQEAEIAKTLKKSNEGLKTELRSARDEIERHGTALGKVIEEVGESTNTVEIDVAQIKALKANSENLTARLGEVTKKAEQQTEKIKTLEARNAQQNSGSSNVFVNNSNNAGNNGVSVAGVSITDMSSVDGKKIDGEEYVPLKVSVSENKSDKLQQGKKIWVQLPEDKCEDVRKAIRAINENVKVSDDKDGLVIDGEFARGSSVVVNKSDLVKYGKKIRVSFEVKDENTGIFRELGSREVDITGNLKMKELVGTMRMKITPVA